MTSLRKKEREYSVLRVVAGSKGDETLLASSLERRPEPARSHWGSAFQCGSEPAREGGFGYYADNS